MPGAVWVTIADGREEIDAVGYPIDTVFRLASLTKPLAAMLTLCLAERSVLSLEDPLDRWLPELTGRRVLRTLASELDDIVPARGRLVVRDLLTMGLGLGWHPAVDDSQPLQRAIVGAGVGPGALAPEMEPDAWVEAVGSLPTIHQPGEGWLYDSFYTALGILLERAGGADLGALLAKHVTGPLGMQETAYVLPERDLARLPEFLSGDPLAAVRPAGDPGAAVAPSLHSGATGLFSTAADLRRLALAFLGDDEALPAGVIEAMRHDHRGPGQRSMSELFLEPAPAGDTAWASTYGRAAGPRTDSAGPAARGRPCSPTRAAAPRASCSPRWTSSRTSCHRCSRASGSSPPDPARPGDSSRPGRSTIDLSRG